MQNQYRKTFKGFHTHQYTLKNTLNNFRNTKHNLDIQIAGISKFKPYEHNFISENLQKVRKSQSEKKPKQIQQTEKFNGQITCTNFMKNYIDKLKKQRKRHNKKVKLNRSSDEKQQKYKTNCVGKQVFVLGGRHNPISYSSNEQKNMFVFQKSPKNGDNKFLNTISIVSENLQQLNSRSVRRHTAKLSKISKQSRFIQSKEQLDNSDQNQQLLGQNNIKRNTGKLPSVQKGIKNVHKTANSRRKSNEININMRTLEPWKQQSSAFDYGIEQYDYKKNK